MAAGATLELKLQKVHFDEQKGTWTYTPRLFIMRSWYPVIYGPERARGLAID
jgi:hypothetical protein